MEYMEKVDLIFQLSDRKRKFNKLFKDEKSKEQLYKWLKSELAYTSNNIEGNTLTSFLQEMILFYLKSLHHHEF